jgi:X-X-X-Leu-X-X-Gly heptad repeat protein
MGINVGNVAVRFSVQDQEAVRKALEQLGRDGDSALRKIDAAGKPVARTMGSVSEIMGDLRTRATATASSLGPVGTILTSLGPAGLAAGAAIGVTVAGLFKLADGANQLADKAGRIRDFGQQVGLTVAQVQALEIAGSDVGLKAEKIAAGLGKLSAEMEQTRRGTGALWEAAQRINPELAEQLARARDLTQFIDRLSKAWDGLSESQRNALSKAALGRGIDLGRLFGQVNEAGGLVALEKGLSKSITLTNEQAKALDDLKDSAERLRTSAWDRFVSIFAESQLNAQLETAQGLDWISRSLKAISEVDVKQSVLDLFGFVTGRSGGPAVRLPDELDALKAQLTAAEDNRARLGPGRVAAVADTTIAELRARIEAIERATPGAGADVPLPLPRPAEPDMPLSAEAQLNIERQRMAVLGAAATPADQLQLKMKELAAATDGWTRNQNEGNRALDAFIQGQARAAVASRTRLGIVTEEELITRGLNDLQDMRRNGFIKSAEEMADAERIMRREIQATVESLQVRGSALPALTRLSIDADKLALNLDQDLASALHSSTSDLIDMAKGTETLSVGLTNLSTKILEAVANALMMKTVVGPISTALSGGLGSLLPVPSAIGNIFDHGGLVPFARGGVVSRPTLFPFAGGTGLMGERGPEAIMPLSRLPDGRLGVTGGSSNAAPEIHIHDHAGVSKETKQSTGGQGQPRVDVELRRMVEDMGERMLSNRGSTWQRALSRTIGSNPARTIG